MSRNCLPDRYGLLFLKLEISNRDDRNDDLPLPFSVLRCLMSLTDIAACNGEADGEGREGGVNNKLTWRCFLLKNNNNQSTAYGVMMGGCGEQHRGQC